jgi:hypothetical protein
MKSIELKDNLQGAKGRKYNDGVLSCIAKTVRESKTTVSSHEDSGFPFKSYMSEGRRQALILSGWSFYLQDDDQIKAVIEENILALESIGEYILAASLAFFHGCSLVRAVQCLNKSRGKNVR